MIKNINLPVWVWIQVLWIIFTPCPRAGAGTLPQVWPDKEWQASPPESQGMETGPLIQMIMYVADNHYEIDGITIIRNGFLILDAVFFPYSADEYHEIFSCTKSITSALIGIALNQGLIKSLDQPILDFFRDKTLKHPDPQKEKITIRQLLTMTSGLNPVASGSEKSTGLDGVMDLDDWAQAFLDRPLADVPGRSFKYNNGGSYLLSAIIAKATGHTTMAFAHENLFAPLGIRDVNWPTCPKGIAIGGSGMLLKPHDMARFGLLFLNHGRWKEKQIIPAAFVDESTTAHISKIGSAALFDGYGFQWWINSSGYYAARGYMGQMIYVIPEKNMVVVFLSRLSEPGKYIPKHLLDKYILKAARSDQALPPDEKAAGRLSWLLDRCKNGPGSKNSQ